jgi:hypothetical protein
MPSLAREAASSPNEAERFTDISKHWAKSSIEKYANIGAFAGEGGRFLPEKEITRGEFVMMLHKALDIKIKYFKAPDIKEFFNDVSNEDPCASNLYDLVVSNVIDHKGSFKPNEALPRDEMVHYIINALKNITGGNYAVIKMMPAPFADDDRITPEYKNDIVEAVLLKIVNGKGNNMFYPQSGCTRAESAVAIDRLMNTAKKFNINLEVVPSAERDNNSLKLKVMKQK